MGGGSLPDLRARLDPNLLSAIVRMQPAEGVVDANRQWCLAERGTSYLVYSADKKPITLNLTAAKGEFAVRWIDPDKGKMTDASAVSGGQTVTLQPPGDGPWAVWLQKQDH
jgi:hypothetical protein